MLDCDIQILLFLIDNRTIGSSTCRWLLIASQIHQVKIFTQRKVRSVNRAIFYFLGMKVRPVLGTAGITYLEADSLIGKKYTYVSSASERQNI